LQDILGKLVAEYILKKKKRKIPYSQTLAECQTFLDFIAVRDNGAGTGTVMFSKLQSDHRQQNNITQFLQAGLDLCLSCCPTNNIEAMKTH